MAGKPISVSFVADTRALNSALGKSERALQDTGVEAQETADKVERVFVRVTDHADAAATRFSILGGAVGDVSGGIETFGKKFGLSGDQIAKVTGASEALSSALMFGAGVADIAAVSTELLNGANLKSTALKVKDKVATIAKAAAEKAGAIASKAMAAAQWLVNAAMTANPIGLVVVALVALIAGLVLAYKKSETFRNIINKAFSFIKKLFLNFTGPGLIIKHWDKIKHVTSVAWDKIKGFVKTGFDLIKRIFLNFTGPGLIIKHWDKIKTVTREAWEKVKTTVGDKIRGIVDTIKGLPGRVKDLGQKFLEAGKHIIGKLVDGMKGVGGIAGDIAAGIKQAIADAVNPILTTIESAINHGIDLVNKLPGVDISHISIPHLAKGGIVNRPTLALIGEAGPEAVVPLREFGNIPGGGAVVINVTAPVGASPIDIGRDLTKYLDAYIRSGGRRTA